MQRGTYTRHQRRWCWVPSAPRITSSVLFSWKELYILYTDFKPPTNFVFHPNISIWNFLSIRKCGCILHSSIYLYQMDCKGDRTSITLRACVTWFSDLLVCISTCEQAPIVCSNASFKLVMYSMVNSRFPSDLYCFCTSLSLHAYATVEIAMKAASKVGIKGYSSLSGPFLCQ